MKKHVLYICVLASVVVLTGCGRQPEKYVEQDGISDEQTDRREQTGKSDTDMIADLYQEIYEEVTGMNVANDLERTSSVISRLGEHGYPAVDSENQVDMTEKEQVLQFCGAVDRKEAARLTIFVVNALDSFTQYDLNTEQGNVEVGKVFYQNNNGRFEKRFTAEYVVDSWQYTKEGYLIFTGSHYSEESYVLTMSDVPEAVALRVEPLDAACREMNRRYILPAGYAKNNIFLCDWNEDDFGGLDFYDIFDKFYPVVYGQPVPYQADVNTGVGAVYHIPEEEFERVVRQYFQVGHEMLRVSTVYLPEEKAYEYKPRGFYEIEYTNLPYPEVVGYTEHSDGTITLTVNAVYPVEGTSRAYTHEVVVRPLEPGGFQYVSNIVRHTEDDYGTGWHTDRLTEQEWEEIYGQNSLITEKEKQQLENNALAAAGQAAAVYRNAEIEDGEFYTSNITNFTPSQCKETVKLLGKAGYASVTEDMNMENSRQIEDFYAAYKDGRKAQVTVFEVNQDGLIGALTFLYRGGKLQTCYVGIGWQNGGIPIVKNTVLNEIEEVRLTEKGYFIYAYKSNPQYAGLRQYWRIKPLSDQCRELTKKYIRWLSYVNYNMLVTDWDSSHAEDILTPVMFEDIYRIYAAVHQDRGEDGQMDAGSSAAKQEGANRAQDQTSEQAEGEQTQISQQLKVENGRIPAELYETVMTTFLPVSIEQIRKKCGYDEKNRSYPYETYHQQYPPFGEVVDYAENSDGTITLIVDGVWPDYNSDCAFTNQIVVQPFPDGTFKYLSNRIEEKELEIPQVRMGK